KINSRRLKLRDAFDLDHHAAAAGGVGRLLADRAAGGGVPLVADRMTEKGARSKPFEAAGAVPGTLVVGIEHVASGVGANAAGGAQAAAGGNRFALGRDAETPAAEERIAGEGASEAKRNPQIAFF